MIGRTEELETLKDCIAADRSRLESPGQTRKPLAERGSPILRAKG